jgi:hypothetical protein
MEIIAKENCMIWYFRGTIVDSSGNGFTLGLWQECVSLSGSSVCAAFDCSAVSQYSASSGCSQYLAARAFMTLACIMSALSAICLVVYIFIGDKIPSIILLATKILVGVSLLTGIIGVGVGINATSSGIGASVGAAAIVGIVGLILNLAGSIATSCIGIISSQ